MARLVQRKQRSFNWSRSTKRARRALRSALRTRRAVEPLERRDLLASDFFGNLGGYLADGALDEIQSQVVGTPFENSTVPLVSDRLPEDVNLFHPQLRTDISQALAQLDDQAAVKDFQDTLLSVLRDGYGILLDSNNDNVITRDDIAVSQFSPQDGDIAFEVALSDSRDFTVTIDDPQLGLSFLPLEVLDETQVALTVGYQLDSLIVEADAGSFSYGFAPANDQLQLDLTANLVNGSDIFEPAEFSAVFGTFGSMGAGSEGQLIVTDQDSSVSGTLLVDFDFDRTAVASTSIDVTSTDIDIHWSVSGQAGSLAPSIDFDVLWDTTDEQWSGSDFLLQNVNVGIDGIINGIVAPALKKIKSVVDPIYDLVKIAESPIPIVDDLIGTAADPYTLLRALQDLDSSGQLAGDYSVALKIVRELSQTIVALGDLTNDVNDAVLMLGDLRFDNVSLRDLQATLLSNWSGSGSLSQLTLNDVSGVDANDIADQLEDALEDNPFTQQILNAIRTYDSGLTFELPFLTNPRDLVYLLIGQPERVDIFRADVFVFNDGPTTSEQPFFVPVEQALTGQFEFELEPHLNLQVGLDGVGVVSALQSGIDDRIVDGFYLAESNRADNVASPPELGVGLGMAAGASLTAGIPFFSASIGGAVTADLALAVPTPANYDGGKIRLSGDLGEILFQVTGKVGGELTFRYRVGFKFLGRCFCHKKEIVLAETEFVTFNVKEIYNPFYVTESQKNFAQIVDDRLLLHVGEFVDLNGNGVEDPNEENPRLLGPDETDESFVVSQELTDNGVKFIVTFGGISKEYETAPGEVQVIEAIGGTGRDVILIDESVTVNALIAGGDGDDTLVYGGSGVATLFGGPGDDQIISNAMESYLAGEEGNDVISGSSRPGAVGNTILGGPQDDIITGGEGLNFLLGNSGNDTLQGLGGDTQFDGGPGIDEVFGGEGGNVFYDPQRDDIHAGAGDNLVNVPNASGTVQLYWTAGDGNVIMQPLGVTADGHAATTQVYVLGDDNDENYDLLVIHDESASLDLGLVTAPDGKSLTIFNATDISIDGAAGSDVIRILGGNPELLDQVSVNGSDNLGSDQDADEIYIVGTVEDDELYVSAHDAGVRVDVDENAPNGEQDTIVEWGATMIVEGLRYRVSAMVNPEDLLQLDTFAGNDNVWVYSSTGTLQINTQDGDDTAAFFVDELGRTDAFSQLEQTGVPLSGYFGPVNFDGGTELSAISVGGQRGDRPDNFSLTDSRIWTDHFSAGYTGDQFLWTHLLGSQNDDVFRVLSTRDDALNLISGQSGDDSARLHREQSLQEIRGSVLYDGEGGQNSLVLDDRSATEGNGQVELVGNLVNGLAGPNDEVPVSAVNTTVRLNLSNDPEVDEVIDIDNPAWTFEVYGGAGNEQFIVRGMAVPGTIRGQSGDDEVRLSDDLDQVTSTLTYFGGGGNDRVDIEDAQALSGQAYFLDGNLLRRGNGLTVAFDASLDALELNATPFDDDLRIINPSPDAVSIRFDLMDGQDTVFGPHQESDWLIRNRGSNRHGIALDILSTEQVIGGTAADTFSVVPGALQPDSTPAAIHGGSGSAKDLLTTPASVRAEVSLELSTVNEVLTFSGLERIRGNHHNDRIAGENQENIWRVDGVNSGSVRPAGQANALRFTNFESLLGGSETDRFLMQPGGSIVGPINGRQGRDWLDYRDRTSAVSVNLLQGSADDVGSVVLIENVRTGAGDDILVGDAQRNILRGGQGSDVLIGNDGRDLLLGDEGRDVLVGGAGPDELFGYWGEDLLIGGWTDHDASPANLQILQDVWSNPNEEFSVRMQQLSDGKDGVAISAATVSDDGQVDQLFGQGDLDWLWDGAGDLLNQGDGRSSSSFAGGNGGSSGNSVSSAGEPATLIHSTSVDDSTTAEQIVSLDLGVSAEDELFGGPLADSFSWTNHSDRFDVNADQVITPLDVLLVVNFLNQVDSGALPGLRARPLHFYDVNGDGHATPLDVLTVVNELNKSIPLGGYFDIDSVAKRKKK